MQISGNDVLYSALSWILAEQLFEVYLSVRQILICQTHTEVPEKLKNVMNPATFEQARLYTMEVEKFRIVRKVINSMIVFSLELYFGFIAYIWHNAEYVTAKMGLNALNEITVSCMFMLLMNIVGFLENIPFKLYAVFVLEERFGFNRMSAIFFITDQIKGFIMNQIVLMPILATIIYIVERSNQTMVLCLWLFTFSTVVFLLTIYPLVIAPLLDDYKPLPPGELRTAIEELAKSQQFPLTELYVLENSQRSAHSNAYFYGFWNSKRIVLYDTILQSGNNNNGLKIPEVVAVLAHELGHWKYHHVAKNLLMAQCQILLIFCIFSYSYEHPALYQSIGLAANERPIIIGLICVCNFMLAPLNTLMCYICNVISRKFEYEADAYANKLGYGKQLESALVKFYIDNLGFPIYDSWYSTWNHTHPTLLQRIDRLNESENVAKTS